MKQLAIIMAPLSLIVASLAIGQSGNQTADLRSQLRIDDAAPERSSVQSGYANIVEQVAPSVVTIVTSAKAQATPSGLPEEFLNDPLFRRFFGDQLDPRRQMPQMPQRQGQGSGVILTSDGYIVTNNHVVDGADEIKVILPNKGGEYEAEVIGRDPGTDIALIKVKANGLPAATLGDSTKLKVGDTVLAIGNPFGLNQTVTTGIVSALSRKNLNIASYENFIQTDASINPGNSGGALVDHQGRVVGINTAIFSRAGGNIGIGFAIPVNMVVDITDRLVSDGSVQRGYLGVMLGDLNDDLARGFGIAKKGVLVNDVMEDTPAAEAGFQPGDVILGFQGNEVGDMADLRMMVANTRPGTSAQFTVLRDGKERKLDVKIGQLPEDGQLASARPQQGGSPRAEQFLSGVQIAGLTPELRQRYSLTDDANGVVVTQVETSSAAFQAGLREGDVITSVARREVASTQDAVAALKEAKGNVVLLRVTNAQGSRFLAIER